MSGILEKHTSAVKRDALRSTLTEARRTMASRAKDALGSNKTFLSKPSPSNAELAAQVKALTRQNSALINLVLNRTDAEE